MPTKNRPPQLISLDQLIIEKIAQRTLSNIELIRIEVHESTGPGISLKVDKKNVELHVNVKTTPKKLAKWIGGLTALVSGMFALLKWLLPILAIYFSKPPP